MMNSFVRLLHAIDDFQEYMDAIPDIQIMSPEQLDMAQGILAELLDAVQAPEIYAMLSVQVAYQETFEKQLLMNLTQNMKFH